MAKVQRVKKHFVLYADGASKRNPGHSGIGFLIYDKTGDIIAKEARYIGEATNNEAEYNAVIDALKKAIDLGAESVEIRSDSQLIVKQLNNEFKVRSIRLKPLYYNVRNLLSKFSTFSVVKIPREKNKLADDLASSAVKEYLNKTKERERLHLFGALVQIDPPKMKRKITRRWV